MTVKIKRIYEAVDTDDNLRILVDRLWPRGVSKERAHLDYWLKEIGPSTELRKWFRHDPEKFTEFKKRYKKELQNGEQQDAFKKLKKIVKESDGYVTLLFATRNEKHNQAQVLKELINN